MIRTPRSYRILQGGVFACIMSSDFWHIPTYSQLADECREGAYCVCSLLGVILIDGFEEDPYLVHRKLALAGTMLLSSYGMASFLSCK